MKIKKEVFVMSIFLILSLLIISAEDLNETSENSTIIDINLTDLNITIPLENVTLNDTLQNITIENVTENITPPNSSNLTDLNITDILNETLNTTDILNTTNLTILNDTLTDLLEEIENGTMHKTNGSYCYYTEDSVDYNMTINGTNVTKTLNLSVSLCYNETTVYCYSNSPSIPTTLFRIDVVDYICKNGYCEGSKIISNPYDISNKTFNNATSFICFSKIKENGYSLWLWQAVNLYEDGNIFYFDFSNSSFNSYDNFINNTVVNNITNNFTIVSNISNDILNNITANLTGLENRVSILESWRVWVDDTLDYILDIIDKIVNLLKTNIFLFNFSGSNFVENNTVYTNETINNHTITWIFVNNITNTVTNNITAENITELEDRVSILETWKNQVNETLKYILEKIKELIANIEELFNIEIQ